MKSEKEIKKEYKYLKKQCKKLEKKEKYEIANVLFDRIEILEWILEKDYHG
jgi:hypothetical protein